MEEILKEIDGYNGDYLISNLGEVYSKKYSDTPKKLVKMMGTDGYWKVSLSKNSKVKRCSIHRLVALAFVDNIENKATVDHIDNDRLNNRFDNLQWLSLAENSTKEIKNLGRHRFTEDEIRWIREHYKAGCKQFGAKPLARKFGIDNHCIRNIVKNKYYTWVK